MVEGAKKRWFRFRWGDVGRAFLAVLGAYVGLELSAWLMPGFELGTRLSALGISVSLFIWGALLRPVLVRLAVLLGWIGAILVGLFGQAVVVWLAVWDPQGRTEVGFLTAFVAGWIVAGVSTLLLWLATAGSNDAVTAHLVRRRRRKRVRVPDPDVAGVVFIQIDGLPYPVLEWGVKASTLPNLSRWVRSGSHLMAEWRPRLPATTPASVMGILHGTTEGIPAFRWVDRAEGRVYVANKPADAAAIEAKHSDGRGLLVDDGVSISNLFTGDATEAYATMSAVQRTQESKESRSTLSQFLTRPAGLARGVTRTVSEIVRERFQYMRARRRDVRPRVPRGWNFTFERAALNGVMRDLNTTLVAESMLKGRKAVYVDFVDYDAVAHHVGIFQPEAVQALEGVDAVLDELQKVAEVAPRKYHFVVLSDHGQSQGAIFADRYGEELSELVHRLAEVGVTASEYNAEGTGSLNALIASSSGADTVWGRALGRVSHRMTEESLEAAEPRADEGPGFQVFGSGNLGLIYVAGEDHRLTLTELSDRFPALVPGLVAHEGIGFVVVDTADHGPVVLGAGGEHYVRDGTVNGVDPLARFGDRAAEFVLRAASMPETPDILVNSLFDDLGEVAAFEGLVGCHGGLGGWQERASLVWPVELPAPEGMIVGAEALHEQLVSWLEGLGHRRQLLREAEAGS